jgi:amidohydrolase
MSPPVSNLRDRIDKIFPELITLRRELHANPELSFNEHQTAELVADALTKIPGLQISRNVAETGVVATLKGGSGPVVALRAELDALPIHEETNQPYASTNAGVMHACGHDGHMAILVGVAKVLADCADNLEGGVKFIFQPAEEEGAGANEMCKAGVLDDPGVDAIFALHGWPQGRLGQAAIREGPAHASTDTIRLTVRGRGAHGGHPHQGIDPIVVSAKIIDGLQTIASRSVAPAHSVVVTIGSIHGGSAVNIIPDSVEMLGTIRTLDPDVRERVRGLAERIIRNTAEAYGAEADLELRRGYPVAVNDPALSSFVRETICDVLGSENLVEQVVASTGADDFAYYAERIPGAIFRLGIRGVEAGPHPALHHPTFDFNEDAIPYGVSMLAELTRRKLKELAAAT